MPTFRECSIISVALIVAALVFFLLYLHWRGEHNRLSAVCSGLKHGAIMGGIAGICTGSPINAVFNACFAAMINASASVFK